MLAQGLRVSSGSLAMLAAMRRGLVLGEQIRCRPPTGLVLEVEVAERLPLGVANEEAGFGFLRVPRWREAALGQAQRSCRSMMLSTSLMCSGHHRGTANE